MTMTLESVHKWVADAIADGWTAEPTYGNTEPIERAARLTRDGFVVQAITRPKGPPQWAAKDEVKLSVWGPDDLAVKAPATYSMAELQRQLHVCGECNGEFEKIVRLGFAGRVCPECRVRLAPTVEHKGWCD